MGRLCLFLIVTILLLTSNYNSYCQNNPNNKSATSKEASKELKESLITPPILDYTLINESNFPLDSSSLTFNTLPSLKTAVDTSQTWSLIKKASDDLTRSDFRGSLYHLMQAQYRFDAEGNERGKASVLLLTGAVYQAWKTPSRALDYYLSAARQIKSFTIATKNTAAYTSELYSRICATAELTNKFDTATIFYQRLIALSEREGNFRASRLSYARLADIYARQGNTTSALRTLKDLININYGLDNPFELATTYNNLGFLYKNINEPQLAIHNFLRALTILRINKAKPDKIIAALVNIGAVYNQGGFYQAAVTNLEKAITESKTANYLEPMPDVYNFLAITHYNGRAYSKALNASTKAVESATKAGQKEVLVRALRTKAIILQRLLRYRAAAQCFELYAELKDTLGYEQRVAEQKVLMRNLSVEKMEKDLRLMITDAERNSLIVRQSSLEAEREIRLKEMQLLQREKELQDYSISNQSLQLAQADLERRNLEHRAQLGLLELERNHEQSRIERLEKQTSEQQKIGTIRLLSKDKKLLEQARKYQLTRLKAQQDREKLFVGLIALALIAAAATYVSMNKMKTSNLLLRLKQDEVEQTNLQLGHMNDLIGEKNRSITDSFRYASQIQSAFMPGPAMLHSILPLSFLFNRARDLVSGDFFYLHQQDQFTYIAVGDCTGRGVSGAMLSMVAHQALKNIVENEPSLKPSQILHKLDSAMEEIFHNKTNEVQQCLDIGICIIDHQLRRLNFAGAVQKLYVYTEGKIRVVNSQRCSIGGLVPKYEKQYQTYTLPITDQMQCFMATDGIQNQLGGPDKKRFTSKRMEDLYVSLSTLPSAAKFSAISNALDDWQATYPVQLDDMLVLGFRPDLVSRARNAESPIPVNAMSPKLALQSIM
jgi:serine phosphatase RsbU (regulator of sigma subunit)/tetratricopeptide (TPR) repeat protein